MARIVTVMLPDGRFGASLQTDDLFVWGQIVRDTEAEARSHLLGMIRKFGPRRADEREREAAAIREAIAVAETEGYSTNWPRGM